MNFVVRWYKRNIQPTPEQTKIFFRLLPIFLVLSFFVAKTFPAVSILWFIIYCVMIAEPYDSKYIKNRPAFPFASKFPLANAVVHSIYFSWAVMGVCWMPINDFFVTLL